MISQAFIQEWGNGQLGKEERLIAEELNRRGIAIAFYTQKRIRRRQLALNRQSLVVRDMSCIVGALKQLGIPEPPPNDYPTSLSEFLHRRVWRSTFGDLELGLQNGRYPPTFAKPAARRKRFTGCVFYSECDLSQVYGVSRQEKLLCSEVVSWLSEYRVYVVHSQIRSINHYAGNPDIPLDLEEIHRAIQALDKAGDSYAGYAIDFGVLASGETALIEMNDGFAIGAYGIDCQNYTDTICARWEELLGKTALSDRS